MSSLGGLAGTAAWYLLAYRSTSMGITGLSAPGIIGAIHPILPGVASSFTAFILFAKKGTFTMPALSGSAAASEEDMPIR
jgi:SSS family solute:Na+ symporter